MLISEKEKKQFVFWKIVYVAQSQATRDCQIQNKEIYILRKDSCFNTRLCKSLRRIRFFADMYMSTVINLVERVHLPNIYFFCSVPEMCSWLLPGQERIFPGSLCALRVQRSG